MEQTFSLPPSPNPSRLGRGILKDAMGDPCNKLRGMHPAEAFWHVSLKQATFPLAHTVDESYLILSAFLVNTS